MEEHSGIKKSFRFTGWCKICGNYMNNYSSKCSNCGLSFTNIDITSDNNITPNNITPSPEKSKIPVKSDRDHRNTDSDGSNDSDDTDIMVDPEKSYTPEVVVTKIGNNKIPSPKKANHHNVSDSDDDTDDTDDTDDSNDTTKYKITKHKITKHKIPKSDMIKKEMIHEIFMTAIVNYLLKKYESKYKKYDIDENRIKKSLKDIIKNGRGINLTTVNGREVTVDNCDPEYKTVIEYMYKWIDQQRKYYSNIRVNDIRVNDICDNFVKQSFYSEFEKNLSEFYNTCVNSNYDDDKYQKKKDYKTEDNEKDKINEKNIPKYTDDAYYDYKYSEEEYIKKQFKDTFYNAMKTECLFDMMFDIDDFIDREPHIYLSLPSCAILAMTDCENDLCKTGIRLSEGIIIHSNDCPKEYKIIFDTVINIRDRVKIFNKKQKLLTKYKLLPEKTIPDELESLLTPNIIEIVTIINNASIEISQAVFYKEDIDNIIKEIITLLK